MTATTFGSVRTEAAEQRRFPLAPAEGWTTLGLVLLLCLTLAWSIDDASWVVGPRGLTDYLPLAIVLGVAWGFVSAKVGWSRWLAHLLGATFAALLMPMIVGARLVEGGGPVEWFQATAASCVNAYFDLTYRGLPFTTQIGHFLLVLGLLVWATGQYAGYVTFHHRRPLNAVIVIGVGLVANMSLTIRDQLPYLVIYSLAALFLLIRFHAYDERLLWMRHRIGDAASLGSLYLRGGAVFVASAVVLALVLTSGASSAPLASLWKGVDQKLIEVGREFQRVFRGGGQGTRFNGVDFSGTASIQGSWTTDPTPVLDITVPDNGHYYWRAVVYDKFDGLTWSWSKPAGSDMGASTALLDGTGDDPSTLKARKSVQFGVTELAFDPQSVFSPDTPIGVNVASKLTTVSDPTAKPDFFAGLNADASRYTVTASVPIVYSADHPEGVSENQLRVAGKGYPDGIRALYVDYDPALIGPATRKLNEAILARYPDASKDPYDLARSINNYLTTDGGFSYDADVRDIDCGRNIVECFAVHKRGYCEYYASTMVMLLRLNDVPARLAEGFLPAQRDRSGVEQILKSNSHAWVEVYFPGFGWQQFDPTGGGSGPGRAPATRPARLGTAGHAARLARGRRSGRAAAEHSADHGRGRRDDRRRTRQRSVHCHRAAPGDRRGRAGVPRLAARATDDVRAGDRLAQHRPARRQVRLRASPEPDRLRVHERARRGAPQRATRPPDGRPGKGRGGLWSGPARRRSVAISARRPAPAPGRAARAAVQATRAPRAPGTSPLTAPGPPSRRVRGSRPAREPPPRPRCAPRPPRSLARPSRPGGGRGGRSGCGRAGSPARRRTRRR